MIGPSEIAAIISALSALIGAIGTIIVAYITRPRPSGPVIIVPPGRSAPPRRLRALVSDVLGYIKGSFKRLWIIVVASSLVFGFLGYRAGYIIGGSFIDLKVEQSSNATFVVSWKNLPQENDLYLVVADRNRIYDPKPIGEQELLSGNRIIVPGAGITSVAVTQILTDTKNFPSSGIPISDKNVHVKILKPIH